MDPLELLAGLFITAEAFKQVEANRHEKDMREFWKAWRKTEPNYPKDPYEEMNWFDRAAMRRAQRARDEWPAS